MSFPDDERERNSVNPQQQLPEEPAAGIGAMEDPTPIAKFGSMAEAGFFVQELEFQLGIPAAIFEDQEFNSMMGAFANFARIVVPGEHADEAIEFLKTEFKKDEEDADALEELFGKESPQFDQNPYAADDTETNQAKHPLVLLVLLIATAGLIVGLMLQ